MKQLALAAMVCSLALGCSDIRPDARETSIEPPELTAEIARAALVAMFVAAKDDSMEFYEVEKWRESPLKSPVNGRFSVGPLVVDLTDRTYRYTVSRPGPEGKGGFYMENAGEFRLVKNKWIATPILKKSIS